MNENQFRQCNINNLPDGPIHNCPAGTVCASSVGASCLPPSSLVQADCEEFCSGQCSPNDIFICTGPYSFRSCIGSSTDSVCSPGYICTQSMCQLQGEFDAPLCPNLTPPSPTLPPQPNFCEGKLNQGRYTSSPPDPFCQKYTFCYLYNGVMRSKEYTCPGTTLFDASTGSCIAGIPTGCVTRNLANN